MPGSASTAGRTRRSSATRPALPGRAGRLRPAVGRAVAHHAAQARGAAAARPRRPGCRRDRRREHRGASAAGPGSGTTPTWPAWSPRWPRPAWTRGSGGRADPGRRRHRLLRAGRAGRAWPAAGAVAIRDPARAAGLLAVAVAALDERRAAPVRRTNRGLSCSSPPSLPVPPILSPNGSAGSLTRPRSSWTWCTSRGRPRWPPRRSQAGSVAISGFELLLHQAARQVELMTGRTPPVRAMREAGLAELARRTGIINLTSNNLTPK